jgi:hypothetical protein
MFFIYVNYGFMNGEKIMRRAAGAILDANGRPDDFDHLSRRPVRLDVRNVSRH